MKLILIRHAKVLMPEEKKIYTDQISAWVEAYDQAQIDRMVQPDHTLIEQLKETEMIVASALPRTKASLEMIGIFPSVCNSLFDEAELPEVKGCLIKLYPKTWMLFLRVMMLLRIGKKGHTLSVTKRRAEEAYLFLEDLTEKHGNVALMGHGGMNWFVGKILEKRGWVCGGGKHSTRNWGYKVYEIKKKSG